MAENKKSIIVYADWIDKFEELEDDEAGRLIKHFFRYVNDLNPEYPDRTTKLMFIDIKATLKRDLTKWEDKAPQRIEKARVAGLASAEARKLKKQLNSTNELEVQLNPTKSTVSVSVSGNVSETDINNNNNINGRKLKFAHTLKPFVDLYGKEMIRRFYEYWTEHGEKDLKFRMEKEKSFGIERRLKTWATNNYDKKPQTNEELNNLTTEIRNSNPRI